MDDKNLDLTKLVISHDRLSESVRTNTEVISRLLHLVDKMAEHMSNMQAEINELKEKKSWDEL